MLVGVGVESDKWRQWRNVLLIALPALPLRLLIAAMDSSVDPCRVSSLFRTILRGRGVWVEMGELQGYVFRDNVLGWEGMPNADLT